MNVKKIRKNFAKFIMKLWPAYSSKNDVSLGEVFNQNEYLQGSEEYKNRLKLDSAQFRYDYEANTCFFERYFPTADIRNLEGKKVLDLGSFTGGRAVYWSEKYGFQRIYGIDIHPIFAQAGRLFAKKKNITATFLVGMGEFLPFTSESFDAIISYDVLEHVQDVGKVLNECFRILKRGGKMFLVFPTIYQPLESHLLCVTKIPALNLLFSGETILQAYQEIIEEREPTSYWYKRKNWELESWEKLPSLNGITVARFRKLLKKNQGWHLELWRKEPIFSSGRLSKKAFYRILRFLFFLPAHLPILEEFFLDRVCCILIKRTK